MLIVVWLRIGLPSVTSPIVSPRCNSRGFFAIIPHPKLPVIFSRLNGESRPPPQDTRVYKEDRWGIVCLHVSDWSVLLYPVQTVTKSSSCPLKESQRCKLGGSSVSKCRLVQLTSSGDEEPSLLEVSPYHYLNVLSKRAKYDYF